MDVTNMIFRIATLVMIVLFNWLMFTKFLMYYLLNPFAFRLKPKDRVRPKCLYDQKYGKHKYAIVNGIRMHYVEKGDHKKPMMLFVHGFPEFWYSWRHQIVEFSKDYWCVAIDMRGFGDSDKPQELETYIIPNLIEDIKKFVEIMDKEKFILVSHDWGSVISWSFRDLYPEKLLGFIAMDAPSTVVWRKLIATDVRQLYCSWYIFFFQGKFIPEHAIQFKDFAIFNRNIRCHDVDGECLVTPEDFEAYKYMFSQPGALTSSINYYRANIPRDPIPDNPGPCPVPSLYIHAEQDRFVRMTTIELLRETYPDLAVQVIRGTGHYVQQESPRLVNAAMREFFKNKNI